jgi:hypothetical protein
MHEVVVFSEIPGVPFSAQKSVAGTLSNAIPNFNFSTRWLAHFCIYPVQACPPLPLLGGEI